MIPLLLFFLTINFQSDFKGFSSKDEALYYSELLKCEGYFTKNDNDKIFYFPCSSESELQNAYQEIEVEPTVTEIWDPEPDVINPGNSFRDAPSDAIILFSKDNLNEWVHKNGKEAKWIVKDDYFTVNPGTGDILLRNLLGAVSYMLNLELQKILKVKVKVEEIVVFILWKILTHQVILVMKFNFLTLTKIEHILMDRLQVFTSSTSH